MEVIDTDVAVTIVYPPGQSISSFRKVTKSKKRLDMTTPGLVEENRTKPEIARKIAEMADEVHPDKIVKGKFSLARPSQTGYILLLLRVQLFTTTIKHSYV